MNQRRRTQLLALVVAVGAVTPSFLRADTNRIIAQPSPDAVKATMTKAVDFLLGKKLKDNFEVHGAPWIVSGPNTGGETAIVAYALLHAGRSLNDARLEPNSAEMKPVLAYLAGVKQDGTYAAGLTALALDFLPKSDTKLALFKESGTYLLNAPNENPKTKTINGGYSYNLPLTRQQQLAAAQKLMTDLQNRLKEATAAGDNDRVSIINSSIATEQKHIDTLTASVKTGGANGPLWGTPDNSNSQYGVLGAWAMERSGIDVPTSYWHMEDQYWRTNQQPDGGWHYQAKDDKPSLTMSVAGLASLYIISEFTNPGLRLEPVPDPQIDKALAKVTADYTTSSSLYYLYGVERVGLASGLKFFGTHNWFREGASALVKSQHATGSFTGGFSGATAVNSTAYALLFLARGRNPIPFNKLQYDGPWNARAWDDANLVEWMGDAYEKEFNWQVVNLQVDPEEWMDSPILLITGSKELKFAPADKAKIKKFVEMGGMIFSTSDGATGAFDRSIHALMKELFPDYAPLVLKKDSVFFDGELRTKPVVQIPMAVGLSNGVRYLWVHTPTDMGASWAKRSYQKVADFQLPLNVYFYAESMDTSRTRLEDPVIRPGKGRLVRKATIARLDLGDHADPEPFAIERLKLIAAADGLCAADTSTVQATELPGKKPTLTLLTGTGRFKPSADEAAALQKYLADGGTLLADAAGGNAEFTQSMVEMAPQIVPGGTVEDVPATDKMLDGSVPGAAAIKAAVFRKYARLKTHARSGDMTDVRLRGIKIGNRWAVIFSEYDITSGLLGTDTWGINGYAAETAEAIARDVLMYAVAGRK
jgi:hypothetical protein